MKAAKTEILICIECDARFSTADVGGHLYFPECATCYECLAKMKMFPARVSCFGDPKLYDPSAEECARYCQDRLSCRMFAAGEIMKRLELTADVRAAALDKIRQLQKVESNFRKKQRSNPFRHGSLARPLFDRLREQGMTRGEFDEYLDAVGANHAYYWRIFRKEFRNGVEWKFEESGDSLRIVLK